MKRVLFISQSELSHNLIKMVIPLLTKKIDVTCALGLEDITQLDASKKIHLVVVDGNVLEGVEVGDFINNLKQVPFLSGVMFALIYGSKFEKALAHKDHFQFTAKKPFLPMDLANHLVHWSSSHA